MKLYVDRIVEGISVMENDNGEIIKLKLNELPQGTKEGSVIVFENGTYTLDSATEEAKKEELFNLQNFLFGEDE